MLTKRVTLAALLTATGCSEDPVAPDPLPEVTANATRITVGGRYTCAIAKSGPATDGTRWEIDWIMSHGALSRTVFVMPPLPSEQRAIDWAASWQRVQDAMARHSLELPSYHPSGLLFTLADDGSVSRTVVVSPFRDANLGPDLKPLLKQLLPGHVQPAKKDVFAAHSPLAPEDPQTRLPRLRPTHSMPAPGHIHHRRRMKRPVEP